MVAEINIKEKRERTVFYRTLGLAWELGYTIAGPLVALAFLGRFLDKKYESSPVLLLSGMLLAIIVSGLLVFRKTKKILEDSSK